MTIVAILKKVKQDEYQGLEARSGFSETAVSPDEVFKGVGETTATAGDWLLWLLKGGEGNL